ncbi:MAG: hypothetical protein HC773_16540 [Scytonema sp. CRU_2_7]|nr:hypothetical protein [Scytonema sp. CRU_2_7]
MKELGSTDDEFISCNTTVPIMFKFEDWNIQLKPEDYLETDMPDGKCGLIGEVKDKSTEFLFPQVFFQDHCMGMENYNGIISIATRRSEKAI